jgi:hypothetical protein
MTLRRLYIIGVLIPGLIAIVATTISTALDNEDYQSEWLTKDAVVGMTLIVSLVHSVVISMLSLTIFLNRKKQTDLLTFLTWFLLPITWISITVYKTLDYRLNEGIHTKRQLLHLISLNLPFVIGLILTYTIFVRQKRINNTASHR